MAHISQEHKKEIHAEIKTIIPDWKFSLSVGDGQRTLRLCILSAEIDLPQVFYDATRGNLNYQFVDFLSGQFDVKGFDFDLLEDKALGERFGRLLAALNDENFNDSDPYTDYYHVGWYVELRIGHFEKPFVFKERSKLKKRIEASLGQPLQKYDPTAEGGAM